MPVRPFIWDFDDSVLEISGDEIRHPLQGWQERIRFGCTKAELARLEERVNFPENGECVFLGSGDYHHLSLLLLKKAAEKSGEIDVVVCDNHPDNMRYAFGVHCGSWVFHASRIPGVRRIHVVGIASDDITAGHCWENYLSPLRTGRVAYWSVGKNAKWLNWLGAKTAHRDFARPDALVDSLIDCLGDARNIYLSLDKDVFGRNVVETNWDQGCFEFGHFRRILSACRDRLAGMDVTGEVSAYRYRGLLKRLLAKRDGLAAPDPGKLEAMQEKQRDINRRILELLR